MVFFLFFFFLGYRSNYKQSYISKPENHKPFLKAYIYYYCYKVKFLLTPYDLKLLDVKTNKDHYFYCRC